MKMMLICLLLTAFSGISRNANTQHAVVPTRANKYAAAEITNAPGAERFFRDIQQSVAKNDRTHVAALIDFPLTVHGVGRNVVLRRKSDFIKHYDVVFNRNVKSALAAQKVGNLFVNVQGVMVGSGQIWFNQKSSGSGNKAVFKIIAINN